jgi:membrane protein
MNVPAPLQDLLRNLSQFPWKNTALTLRERFREDRLGLTASSLTFTTTIALVPFFTVALAVFSAFPMFGKVQDVLQRWLIDSLVPDSISRQVLGYLTQFASRANRLGVAGLAILLFTALALMLTIDRTLNSIWRVPRARPLAQRVLVYWAAITLGPVLLGASLAMTSYLISASRGLVGTVPGGVRFLLDTLEFALLAGGMAALYHFVPNTPVRWKHALAGGAFVAAGIELAKKLLAYYVASIPTYSMVYGAFATVPILLIWIYVAWVIVLLGAVIAAYLPSLLAGVARRGGGPGWQFQLALEALQRLHDGDGRGVRSLSAAQLAYALQVEELQVQAVLQTLVGLDWVGELAATDTTPEARYVLITQIDSTPLAPLMRLLLVEEGDAVGNLWKNGHWSTLMLADALQKR